MSFSDVVGALSPAAWNGVSVVTLLIIAVAALVWLLLKGHIVLGVHHREIVAQKDRDLNLAEERDKENAAAISKFADAAARSTAAAEVQQAVVTALRQIAEERS